MGDASGRLQAQGSQDEARQRPPFCGRAFRLLPWVPLAAGLTSSYGPVALNYGFALYFLNYKHGFVKRGAVGELFAAVPHFSRAGLLAIEFVFLLLAFAITYIVLRRLFFGSYEDRVLAAVLFAAPALLPHIGFLFAQPDVTLYILLLLAIAAFIRLPPISAALLSTLIACVALLVHEACSLAFYPLLAAILLDLCRSKRLSWWLGVLQVAVVFAAFVAIMHFGSLKVSADTIVSDAAHRTSVPLQRQVFDVMASSLAEQLALVRRFYSYRDMQILYSFTALLSVPYFALLARLLRCTARARGDRALDLPLRYALFLLPLALCALGHDVSRWIAACGIDATLFLCYLALTDGRSRDALRAWATGPIPFLWLAWFLVTGPYGATGIRMAEQMSVLWNGP